MRLILWLLKTLLLKHLRPLIYCLHLCVSVSTMILPKCLLSWMILIIERRGLNLDSSQNPYKQLALATLFQLAEQLLSLKLERMAQKMTDKK